MRIISPATPAPLRRAAAWFNHWLVLFIASAGWLFDCMDQRIFTLARESAVREFLGGAKVAEAAVRSWGAWATTTMMFGWATGGIVFGTMSDRLGRVKTMVVALLTAGQRALIRLVDTMTIGRTQSEWSSLCAR